MWYWIALIVAYSLLMGWGFSRGEIPQAKPLSFIAGVWAIGGLAISLGTIVAVLGKLTPSYYGWGLVPILSMCIMVMGCYGLSVQVLMDKSERITYNHYSRLHREERREEARREEARREEARREQVRLDDARQLNDAWLEYDACLEKHRQQ